MRVGDPADPARAELTDQRRQDADVDDADCSPDWTFNGFGITTDQGTPTVVSTTVQALLEAPHGLAADLVPVSVPST